MCQRETRVEVFPALARPVAQGSSAEAVLLEGEAACFYHPQKRAVVPCSACGRFLCALCDLEFNAQHLCPACLESGQRKGQLTALDMRRTLYDSGALTLAVVPVLLCWPVSFLTAPAAIGLAVYGWRKPGSILPRTRARAVAAIALGLLQIVGWGAMILMYLRTSWFLTHLH